ncbi:MAG: transcriptional repressor [Dehalococcoidia bacterium]|nr:transcriptional repressor [Dehalococcoidia bacterium]MDW8120298.1 Fur family transcriptional regulator [Chloroflexota bacterium]
MIPGINIGGPEALLEALAQRGMRLTGPRRRLVQAIAGQKGLFTAEALHSQVPDVGRATVFRTLKALVSAGLVCRVSLEHGAPRYGVASRLHHHHLVCVACGGVQDFVPPEVEALVHRLAQPRQFRVLGHRLEIYGLCAWCQAKEKEDLCLVSPSV